MNQMINAFVWTVLIAATQTAWAAELSLRVTDAKAFDGPTTRPAGPNEAMLATILDAKQFLKFEVDSAGGTYRVQVRYRASGGKGFELKVDGLAYTNFLPASPELANYDAGLIELPAGHAEVSIGGGRGHYDIAGLTLTPAKPDAPPKVSATALCDPASTPEARELYRRLTATYGRVTLSGVHEFADVDYVREKAGHDVAILSRDLMDYSPSRIEHGSKPGDMVERVIDAAKQGRIVTLCWHWNAPADLIDEPAPGPDGKPSDKRWFFGFYTRSTTFDFAKALSDEDGADYQLLVRDIDAIAVQLKKLSDAHVPVLWRPLHEAEGGWFWWGARGSKAYVKLWRLMFDRLTRVHHLNNLIWVYTSAGDPAWYPGDDCVDLLGADAYPADNRDPLVGIWNTLRRTFGDRKPLTLSEVGMVPDADRMRRLGVDWLYFCTWSGKLGPRGMKDEELRGRLASPAVRGRVAK